MNVGRATTAACATRVGEAAATSSASAVTASPVLAVATASTRAPVIPASTAAAAARQPAVTPSGEAVDAVDRRAAVVDVGNTAVVYADADLTGASVRRDSEATVVSSVAGPAPPTRASGAPSAKKLSAAKDTLVSRVISCGLIRCGC